MPTTELLPVKKLSLDLKNFRTVPQKNEVDAIRAMISIKQDRFLAILESILEDGYLPTESIIILRHDKKNTVKEGNRRIAAMKLLNGFYKLSDFTLPTSIAEKIKGVSTKWKRENENVPCTVFSKKESNIADRIVKLAHGKGEKASKDPWNSVARARHNRDVNGANEPALDLLEKYLKHGKNLNAQQKERWGGDFPLTVLEEAMKKIHDRLDCANIADLTKKYPKISFISEFEFIILTIGNQSKVTPLGFEEIRADKDFAASFGIPPINNTGITNSKPQTNGTSTVSTPVPPNNNDPNTSSNQNITAPTPQPGTSSNTSSSSQSSTVSPKAYATNDPRNVADLLKKFNPRGINRQKVVTLRDEIKRLKIKDNPIAFCFVLRSMFEISSKAYCHDHSITSVNSSGNDIPLVDILRSITKHLTSNNTNKAMIKVLHGAMTEIGRKEGLLSVTSMNQLVHSIHFSMQPSDISTLFGNIYPLLEAMN